MRCSKSWVFPKGSSSSLPPGVLGHDWLQNSAVGVPQTWGAAGWEEQSQPCSTISALALLPQGEGREEL